MEFADPKTLDESEIINAYEQSSLLVDWANSVSAHILKEALEGKAWPGYKLVEGRSVRKWINEETVLKALTNKGYKMDQITNTKIKGIGDIEKLITKERVQNLGLTVKPQGKPTLVPESDKRPAFGIERAKKDFE